MSRQVLVTSLRDLLRAPLRYDRDIPSVLIRFQTKIQVSESGCWIWIGCINDKKSEFPYGRFRFRGKMQYAHRVSYYLFRAPLRRDREIMHNPLCDSEACVHPFHLTQGTHSTNMSKKWIRRYYGNAQALADPPPPLFV